MTRLLLIVCVLGAASVILLQASLSHRLTQLRFRAGEKRKLLEKKRSETALLIEDVGNLDREISYAEASIRRLKEEIVEFSRMLGEPTPVE